ncbi:MAG: DEAD/DEAH box helicase, partial [Synergistaceae bacterium]|nr:DEAD/DEAH box helicase [Synergistaceae bacterium]
REILKHTDTALDEICVFGDGTDERSVPRDAMWHVIGLESVSQSDRVALTAASLATKDAFAIVDESSHIKGWRAKRTQRLIAFCEECRYRMILTGTPMTQGVPDLFSQMYFLSPKILGYRSWWAFAANHLEYDKKIKGRIVGAHDTGLLAAKMAPYVFQVTKDECLRLPEKLHHRRWVGMTEEQEEAYQRAKDEFCAALDEMAEDDWDALPLFRLFGSLQTIVCGFWRRTSNWWDRRAVHETVEEAFPHRRLGALLDVIAEIPEGEKIVVWAKYRFCLAQIVDALSEAYGEGSVAQFWGGIPPAARERELEKFRGPARFLVATQSCGGYGLTLNEAAYAIFYADGYKYAERLQAEDRCHRIGQARPVTYITIQSDAKIEDRISAALDRKGDALRDLREEIGRVKGKGIRERARELIMRM